jgi:hypothetical protein
MTAAAGKRTRTMPSLRFTPPKRHAKCKTLTEAARHLAMSRKTLSDWRSQGLIRPDAKGRWCTRTIARLVEERMLSAGKGESPSLEAWRQARAEHAQLRLAAARGEMISLAEVEKGRVLRIRAVKAAMFELPRRLAHQLAAESDPWAVEDILRKEFTRICRVFAGDE